jgi:hypothetical protein
MASALNNIKITKQVEVEIEDILNGIAGLETKELEKFVQRVGNLIARRNAEHLPQRETELLMKINKAIPIALQKRYEQLLRKNSEETITPDEYKELRKTIDKIENKNAQRLEYLIELAHLRNLSLDALMNQLNLMPFQND